MKWRQPVRTYELAVISTCVFQELMINIDLQLNLKECSDELSLLRLRNSTLESEKGQYSSQLKEVVNSNIKWQEYDAEREKYIRKITQEKCELQSILASHNSGMTPSQQVDIDRIITQYKKKVHEAETESQLVGEAIFCPNISVE